MKKAIVTGANGFVGHAVTECLARQGVEVIALVHTVQKREYEGGALVRLVPFEMKDISRLPELIPDRDVDVFYHFAWNGGHGSDRNDTAVQLQNVQWSVECLRAAHAIGCRRFVGVGTIMEFETYYAANEQESRPGLGYIYGGAKLAAHAMLKSVAASLGIEFVWGMLINAFGVGEKSPRLINRTIRDMLSTEEPLAFTPGEQNYDFVYIDDAARAFYLLGEKGVPFKSYMIGSGHAQPLKNFLYALRDTVAPGRELGLGAIPSTGVDTPLEIFSIDELKKDTGYEPEVPFTEGIMSTANWIMSTRGGGK